MRSPVLLPAVCTIDVVIGGGAANVVNGSSPRSVTLGQPQRALVDAAGNLWFTEYTRHRAWKLDAASGVIVLVAGTGVAGFSGRLGGGFRSE